MPKQWEKVIEIESYIAEIYKRVQEKTSSEEDIYWGHLVDCPVCNYKAFFDLDNICLVCGLQDGVYKIFCVNGHDGVDYSRKDLNHDHPRQIIGRVTQGL